MSLFNHLSVPRPTHLTELPKTNVRASTVAEKVEKPLTLQAAQHSTVMIASTLKQSRAVDTPELQLQAGDGMCCGCSCFWTALQLVHASVRVAASLSAFVLKLATP